MKELVPKSLQPIPLCFSYKRGRKKSTTTANLQTWREGGGGNSSVQGGGLLAFQKYTLHKSVGVHVGMHMDSNCTKNKIDMFTIFTSKKLR